jgi:hypothetical protein
MPTASINHKVIIILLSVDELIFTGNIALITGEKLWVKLEHSKNSSLFLV